MKRGLLVLVGLVGIFFYLLESNPEFGPWLADTGRDWLGPEYVARGEEAYYLVKDAFERKVYSQKPPEALWKPLDTRPYRPPLARMLEPEDTSLPEEVPLEQIFPPPDFLPPKAPIAAPNDGNWERFPEPDAPLARTTVHPDPLRPYAAVAIVAMDLSRLNLRLIAGTYHPSSPLVPFSKRTGKIPFEALPGLVAIFNGGWQSIHGGMGMMVDGEEYLPLNSWGCTILLYQDEHIEIVNAARAMLETGVRSFRQAAPCLVENSVEHPDLGNEGSLNWGFAVSGGSIITRSALGIDVEGRFLYYAVGNHLSAQSIAQALTAAGASSVALLDINTWFPRWYTVEPDSAWDAPTLMPLLPKMRHANRSYWDVGYSRDFFYVTEKDVDK
jgi:hypothetical protein